MKSKYRFLYHKINTPMTICWQQKLSLGAKEAASVTKKYSAALPHFFCQSLYFIFYFLSLVRGANYDRGSKLFSLKMNNSLVHILGSVNLMTFKGHSSKKKTAAALCTFFDGKTSTNHTVKIKSLDTVC